MDVFGLVPLITGLFAIVCAAVDFDWYMNHRKARVFCTLLTRTGARVFYIVLGLGLTVLGVLMLAGVVDASM